MEWKFFIIACETHNNKRSDICYGIAWNLKRSVQWSYNLKSGEVEVHDSLVGTSFYKELFFELSSSMKLIKGGHYAYDFNRVSEASRILAEHELKKQSYGIE